MLLTFPLAGGKWNALEKERASPTFLQDRLKPSNNARVIIVKVSRISEIVYEKSASQWSFPISSVPELDTSKLIFVGEVTEPQLRNYFAIDNRYVDPNFSVDKATLSLRDENTFQLVLDPPDQAVVSAALSLCQWHAANVFCGQCGSATDGTKDCGLSRRCTSCGKQHFPQIMPAIHVAVFDGKGNVILSQRYKKTKILTILAGFMSHGESAEETVIREVMEETGAKVESLRYIGSQPWAGPNLIMLCYYAVASNSPNLQNQDSELVKVEWVSKDALRRSLAGEDTGFLVPGKWTSAYFMLEPWLNGRIDDFGMPVEGTKTHL